MTKAGGSSRSISTSSTGHLRRFALVLLSLPLTAQTMPSKFYATFANFQTISHPELTGGAAIAIPLDQKQENYSFTTYDVTPRLIKNQFSIQTSVRTGIATSIKDIGPCRIFALVDGGYATTGESGSGAIGGGFTAVCPMFKLPSWKLLGGARIIKTAEPGSPKSYQLGFGRSF